MIQDSMQQTHAMRDAYQYFSNLSSNRRPYNCDEFPEIFEWAPLLEQMPTQSAMRVLRVLDTLRSVVRNRIERTGRGAGAASLQLYCSSSRTGSTYSARLERQARPGFRKWPTASCGRSGLQFRSSTRANVLACGHRGEIGGRIW